MNQTPSPVPGGAGSSSHADPSAFRRGKLLTALVVAGTAAFFLWDVAQRYWFDHTLNAPSFVMNTAIVGLLAWRALRGGELSTGCLMVIYVLMLIPLALFAALLVPILALQFFGLLSGNHRTEFKVNDIDLQSVLHDPGSTLSFLVTVAWVGFACWVLFKSRDVRWYRAVRRCEAFEAQAAAFKVPSRQS